MMKVKTKKKSKKLEVIFGPKSDVLQLFHFSQSKSHQKNVKIYTIRGYVFDFKTN
jgi:hypothetical protein